MKQSNIEVQLSERSRDGKWEFFYNISDVNELDPAEEQGKAWEATVDGEVVGMVIGDRFLKDEGEIFLSRIAVKENYRKQGIGSSLLEHVLDKYDYLNCRVHPNNEASQQMLESVGFKCEGESHLPPLLGYSCDTTDSRYNQQVQETP